MKNLLFALSALMMGIGVACGAFGAHGLRDMIPAGDLAIWEKAVFYQLVHGLGALAVLITPAGILSNRRSASIAVLFLVGTTIFSGSLYVLVLADLRWLGMITPLGGACLIVAWAWVASSAIRKMS